jgi:hypothetical protein
MISKKDITKGLNCFISCVDHKNLKDICKTQAFKTHSAITTCGYISSPMVLEHQIHFDVFFIQISMSHNSIPGSQM